MQRLFSTFPDGWPGAGLLVLRLVAGAVLFHHGMLGSPAAYSGLPFLWRSLAAGAGLLLFAGFWTPFTGVLVAILELWIAFARPTELSTPLLLGTLGIGLAMLGPGAWSIDARFWGRKRIEIRAR